MANPAEPPGRLARIVSGARAMTHVAFSATTRAFLAQSPPASNKEKEGKNKKRADRLNAIPFLRGYAEQGGSDPQVVLQAIAATQELVAAWKKESGAKSAADEETCSDPDGLVENGVLGVLGLARKYSPECAIALASGHVALRNAGHHLKRMRQAALRHEATNDAVDARAYLEQAATRLEEAGRTLADLLKPPSQARVS